MVKIKVTVPTTLLTFLLTLMIACNSSAQPSLDLLYEKLSVADARTAKNVELEIKLLWEQSGSDTIDFLYQKGNRSFKAKEYEAAVGHYSAVVEFAPKFPLGWFARARAYALLEYNGPALRDLETALSLDPRNFFAIMELGTLFAKLGRPDLSNIALERALKVHPNFEAALQFKSSLKQNKIDKKI